MKRILYLSILLICALFVSCSSKDCLTVYAYDSFCSSYGPGQEIIKDFENTYNTKVNLISCGSSVELYSKLIFEGKDCKADVVIGLPDSIEIDNNLFFYWKPNCTENLISTDLECNIYPFNYGYFDFLYNSEKLSINLPQNLQDLTKPQYKDQFILIDPRTSTVGLGLYMWTINEFGLEGALQWWKDASKNALTTASSWSYAYGLFTEGEAPIVISYTTSPIYHMLNENNYSIKAIQFDTEYVRTVEYLGILDSSHNKDLAQKFCNFVLTESQDEIAISNTMYPANTTTILPKEYRQLFTPQSISSIDLNSFIDKLDYYLDQLTEAISR